MLTLLRIFTVYVAGVVYLSVVSGLVSDIRSRKIRDGCVSQLCFVRVFVWRASLYMRITGRRQIDGHIMMLCLFCWRVSHGACSKCVCVCVFLVSRRHVDTGRQLVGYVAHAYKSWPVADDRTMSVWASVAVFVCACFFVWLCAVAANVARSQRSIFRRAISVSMAH